MLGSNYNPKVVDALIVKGFDTIEFGLKIENYESSLRPHLDVFKNLKEEAQESDRTDNFYKQRCINRSQDWKAPISL